MKPLFSSLVVALAAICLSISGCQQPASPIGLAPIYSNNIYTGSEDLQRAIPDSMVSLTLEYCLKTALTNNPDFLTTHTAISAAWARYYQSLSTYAPQISANYNYSASDQTGRRSTPDINSRANTGGLSAQWLIFDGLMREMNALSSKASAIQTEFLNQDARRILIRSVGVAYNNILLAHEQIRIVEEDQIFNQRLLEEAKTRYDEGTATVSEVYNFQVRLMDTENMLITARATELNNRYVLAQLMGLTTVEIPARITFPYIMNSVHSTYIISDVDIYLNAALNNRPDLKAYRTALTATEYNLYSAYGAYSPKVYANAGASIYDGSGSAISRYDRTNYGVSADWIIFDGFNRWNRIRECQSLIEKSHYEIAKAWLMVVSEVRQAHLSYNTYDKQLEVYRLKLELVKKTRDLVVEEYNAGKTTIVRVNEAQRDVVQGESNVASSSVQLLNARIQLEAATGMSQ